MEAPVIVIAAGAGSFVPRRLPLPGAEGFEGSSLFYAVRKMEQFRGRRILVAGGGDSALDWVLNLEPIAGSMALVHRRDDFRAAPDSVEKMRAPRCRRAAWSCSSARSPALAGDGGRLGAVTVKGNDGEEAQFACDTLLAFYGLKMELGPIAGWGLNLERDLIAVDTEGVRDQPAGHLRHRRHLHLSGQAQADPFRLPRGGADVPEGLQVLLPRKEADFPLHDVEHGSAEEIGCCLRCRNWSSPIAKVSRTSSTEPSAGR